MVSWRLRIALATDVQAASEAASISVGTGFCPIESSFLADSGSEAYSLRCFEKSAFSTRSSSSLQALPVAVSNAQRIRDSNSDLGSVIRVPSRTIRSAKALAASM